MQGVGEKLNGPDNQFLSRQISGNQIRGLELICRVKKPPIVTFVQKEIGDRKAPLVISKTPRGKLIYCA